MKFLGIFSEYGFHIPCSEIVLGFGPCDIFSSLIINLQTLIKAKKTYTYKFLMNSRILKLTKFYQASKKPSIPRPRDPNNSDSYATKIPQEQVEILMNPKGFMT